MKSSRQKFNGPYNFYNVNCKGACTVNATPPTPWDPDPALKLKFRPDDSFKSQIVRETPLTPAAKNMNTIFQSMLANSVWKNYMLISTQWPSAFQLHKSAIEKPEYPGPEDRLPQAARHDLFAGANFFGEFHARDVQPGRYPARFLELYRLSRKRSGLSKKRVESAARQAEPESIRFHVHVGESTVGRDRAGRFQMACRKAHKTYGELRWIMVVNVHAGDTEPLTAAGENIPSCHGRRDGCDDRRGGRPASLESRHLPQVPNISDARHDGFPDAFRGAYGSGHVILSRRNSHRSKRDF